MGAELQLESSLRRSKDLLGVIGNIGDLHERMEAYFY